MTVVMIIQLREEHKVFTSRQETLLWNETKEFFQHYRFQQTDIARIIEEI